MRCRIVVMLSVAIFFAALLYTTNGCGGVYSGKAMRVPQPQAELELEGTIRDAVTSAPLASARIVVMQGGGTFTQATSGTGTYAVAGLVPGDVKIIVSAPGYRTATSTVAVRKGKTRFDISLTREP